MKIKIKELTIGQWHQICSNQHKKQDGCLGCPLGHIYLLQVSCKPHGSQFDETEIEVDVKA